MAEIHITQPNIDLRTFNVRKFLSPTPLILAIFLFFIADTATIKTEQSAPVFRSSTNFLISPLVLFDRIYVDDYIYSLYRVSFHENIYLKDGIIPYMNIEVINPHPLIQPTIVRDYMSKLNSLLFFHKFMVATCSLVWGFLIFLLIQRFKRN